MICDLDQLFESRNLTSGESQVGSVHSSGLCQIWKGGVRLLVNLEEKKRIAQDLNERFSKAAVVIVTDYKGLDVAAFCKLDGFARHQEL